MRRRTWSCSVALSFEDLDPVPVDVHDIDRRLAWARVDQVHHTVPFVPASAVVAGQRGERVAAPGSGVLRYGKSPPPRRLTRSRLSWDYQGNMSAMGYWPLCRQDPNQRLPTSRKAPRKSRRMRPGHSKHLRGAATALITTDRRMCFLGTGFRRRAIELAVPVHAPTDGY